LVGKFMKHARASRTSRPNRIDLTDKVPRDIDRATVGGNWRKRSGGEGWCNPPGYPHDFIGVIDDVGFRRAVLIDRTDGDTSRTGVDGQRIIANRGRLRTRSVNSHNLELELGRGERRVSNGVPIGFENRRYGGIDGGIDRLSQIDRHVISQGASFNCRHVSRADGFDPIEHI
jgi:hypothetical protein